MAKFGYENKGGSYDILDDSDCFRGYRFTTPANIGPVSKLTFWGSFGSYHAKGIIVLQSNLNIVANGIGNPSSDGIGWHDSIFATPPILEPNTDYILGIVSEDAIFFYYDTGVADYSYHDDDNNYASPTNPIGATTNNYKYSIYATYTPTPAINTMGIQIRGKVGKEGDPDPQGVYGIYQVRTRYGKQVVVKEVFYTPTNPQTVPQQANRQKLTDGVAAWQALTNNQKEIYNERARYKPYSGYNLFLREYLLSH